MPTSSRPSSRAYNCAALRGRPLAQANLGTNDERGHRTYIDVEPALMGETAQNLLACETPASIREGYTTTCITTITTTLHTQMLQLDFPTRDAWQQRLLGSSW